jgi:hypothetical protein
MFSAKNLPRTLFACLTLLVLSVTLVSGEDLRCAICKKAITGQYFKLGGKLYCSRDCLNTILPKCSVCGKMVDGKHMVGPDGTTTFCSQECYNTTLPKCELCQAPLLEYVRILGHMYCREHGKNAPRCWDCLLPFVKGRELADKRQICAACDAKLISDPAVAQKLFTTAIAEYGRLTGSEVRGKLVFRPVPQDELHRVMQRTIEVPVGAFGTERGYYLREENIMVERNLLGQETSRKNTVKSKTILAVFPCRRETLMSTLMHELTHDYLAENFPAWSEAPLWVQEGLCQYAAALYCQRQKLTEQATMIANNPDGIYGNGYRYFADAFGDQGNWVSARRWLEQHQPQQMPAGAPEVSPAAAP